MLKLVMVEDEIISADVNRGFAQRMSEISIVATFYNGRDALDFLLKNPIDLLLLDIGLKSNYSGLQLLTDLRRQGKLIDVIIISARNESDLVNEALHLGIVDYLMKPFNYERFNEALQKFLYRKSLESKGNYTQEDIDRMLANTQDSPPTRKVLKKGLQQQTLDKILGYMTLDENFRKFMTSDQISTGTGFSKMTVRRYMNNFIEEKIAVSRINYYTGGRPSIEYAVVIN